MDGTEETQEVEQTPAPATPAARQPDDPNLGITPGSVSWDTGDPASETPPPEDEGTISTPAADEDEGVIAPFEDTSGWDPERQRRDQEHANEVKSLRSELDELRGKLAAPPPQPQGTGAPDLEGEVSTLMEKVARLGPEADSQELAEAVKALSNTLAKVVKAKPAKADNSGVKQEIEKLRQEIADKEKLARETAVDKAYEEMLHGFDEQYYKEAPGDCRNGAYALVSQMLADKGYVGEKRASLDLLEYMFREAYEKAASGKKSRSRTPPPENVLDPGTGGTTAAPPLKGGSLDEVLADMKKSGQVR